MHKPLTIKKVLVIGSGPIVIGQGAEFDYAGTQACLSLKEEGCEVVLVNNNPATMMTDEAIADSVYFEPLTLESLSSIIEKEKPDGLLGSFGGQTGLNLTVDLYRNGILKKYGVQLLGTSPDGIIKGEDREEFRNLMLELGEPVPESMIVTTVEQAQEFAQETGYPIIVRPAYTLGGSGGGMAETPEQLLRAVQSGLDASPIGQCLVEKSIAGYKEIEFEMMRDSSNTCIAVCSMENIDPVGVHTGDSAVVAPQQTLLDQEFDTLKASAVNIIQALGIIGGCNIQYGVEPATGRYFVIEVNPRVSRSSALASKATGYPIARIAAKVCLGIQLNEMTNPLTGTTLASVEPALDYLAVKLPRWSFDTFPEAERTLGTQMKATGEVMAMERNLPAAFQKAVRALELPVCGLEVREISSLDTADLWNSAVKPDDMRFFSILELIRRGASVKEIHTATSIQPYFIECFQLLIEYERKAKQTSLSEAADSPLLAELKEAGFSDRWLAGIWGTTADGIRKVCRQHGIRPRFNRVDSTAGLFNAAAHYYYSTWAGRGDVQVSGGKKMAVIGSGPIRIGQGVEFDYCSVQGVLALKKAGYETIMINNNPGTVSTDFQIADKLYIEPLTVEDILPILELEKPDGVLVQFGGQTAINLAHDLHARGIALAGITPDQIDLFEDREAFYSLLNDLGIPHIPGSYVHSTEQLLEAARGLGYPVLIRPSYVIGGKGMQIIHSEKELLSLSAQIGYPVLLDKYLKGTELEIDAASDGENVFVPLIFEHIEKAGVHSGDSITAAPPITVGASIQKTVVKYTEKIARFTGFTGIFNIQFVWHGGTLYVLEVNPRASRTVPTATKITGINLVEESIHAILGKPLNHFGTGRDPGFITIKQPVFSTNKLPGVDPKTGPKMQSTGEIIACGRDSREALYKSAFWNDRLYKKWCEGNPEAGFMKGGTEAVCQSEYPYAIREINPGVEFNQWLKEEGAAAFVSSQDDSNSIACRLAASAFGLTVFSQTETMLAYGEAISGNRPYKPKTIKEWQVAGKELTTP